MRKSIVLSGICFLLLAGMVFCGCGKNEKKKYAAADAATLFVKSDFSLVCTVIDSLDKDYYDKEELKSFIDEKINDYNYDVLEEVIKLAGIETEGETVKVIMKYASASHYEAFNQEVLFVGTITDAIDGGYDFNTVFREYKSLKEAALADAIYDTADHVVIMEPSEYMIVKLPDKVKYIGENVVEKDKSTVQIPANLRSYIIYE